MSTRGTIRFLCSCLAACTALALQAADLRVEVANARKEVVDAQIDAAVRTFAQRTAQLSSGVRSAQRDLLGHKQPLFLPQRVVLTRFGVPLPSVQTRSLRPVIFGREPDPELHLTFESAGERSFPSDYKDLLEQTFDDAKVALNAVFGKPKTTSTVRVLNFDADIEDRYAVAGGYYVANGSSGPEIRFPIYTSETSASIAFIHTLLLAYMVDAQYPTDAWNEGMVRSATMAIARTPNAIPGDPSAGEIEAVLESLYDVMPFYDWYSQPGLGANPFIAPNLLATQLPPGGNTGGIFLLRYQMAGSAFGKIHAEHPAFISQMNGQFYQSPGAYQDISALETLAQQALDTVGGGANSTIEGRSFADWSERQPIFDTTEQAGQHVLLQPFPILPTPGSDDFGVFGLVVNAWRSDQAGNETLSSGTVYPIFWRPDDVRFFTTTQEDVIPMSGGFGSAVPNFSSNLFADQIYRATVDMPFDGQVARAALPAGAFATGQGNPNDPNNFFGTLTGFPDPGSAHYTVKVEWIGSDHSASAVNDAFGFLVEDENFNRAQPLTVTVFHVDGGSVTEVLVRKVSKGFGSIALDLKHPSLDAEYLLDPAEGMDLVGMPLQPFRTGVDQVLGLPVNDTLAASYNATLGRYELFPDFGSMMRGSGTFIRPPSLFAAPTVRGWAPGPEPIAVHLRPGWNAVSSPFEGATPFSRIWVTTAAESLSTFDEGLGTIIGTKLFEWSPEAGNPDEGTFVEATEFPAGGALFVRSVRAEGAVLIFFPDQPLTPSMPFTPLARGFGWGGGIDRTSSWESRIRLQDEHGNTSQVLIGRSSDATDGFDLKHDSGLPPSLGGLQASLLGAGRMYRDIRSMRRSRSRYDVELTGLTPGKTYTIQVEPIDGRASLNITHRGRRSRVRGSRIWSFKARSTTETLRVEGGRR
jgi:hypothetical protein